MNYTNSCAWKTYLSVIVGHQTAGHNWLRILLVGNACGENGERQYVGPNDRPMPMQSLVVKCSSQLWPDIV